MPNRTSFERKILSYFGIQTEEQLQALLDGPSFENIFQIGDFKRLPSIVSALEHAIAAKEEILVYGDYDADGVLATSIIHKTFQLLGYPISYYVPSRYLDGYGITVDKVERLAKKGFKWLITVDNGIHAHEAVHRAHELGIKTIITDHHALPSTMIETPWVLHPQVDSADPTPYCGAGIALILSYALLKRWDPYLVALAGIATVADLMPLTGLNRTLVKSAIASMNGNEFNAIRLLIGRDPIDETTLSMKLAPMINSVGRVIENQNINRLPMYFTTADQTQLFQLADWIKVVHQKRKELSAAALAQLTYDAREPVIVIKTNEKEGIIGLIASKISQELSKPVVVLTKDDPQADGYVGSARAPENQSILLALQSLSTQLTRYGGHHSAAGLEVSDDQLLAFEQGIRAYYAALKPHQMADKVSPIFIYLEDLTEEHFEFIERFRPFGKGFEGPMFWLKGVPTSRLRFIKDGSILSTSFPSFKLFSYSIKASSLNGADTIDFIGEFRTSYYLGKKERQFYVLDFQQPSQDRAV